MSPLIQSKPGIPKATRVDREPQVMGATGDGKPQETAPAEATPTRRPRFRSARKDGFGGGTLGRGWGWEGDERLSLQGTSKDGDKREENRSRFCIPPPKPPNSPPVAPKQERLKSSSKPQVLAISPGAEGLESVTRSRSEGWDSHGGSRVPQACKDPSVPL